MTFEEIIYDVLEIKNAIDDDTDLEEMWILHKINRYRALHIAAEYGLTNEIDPTWLQRIHKFTWERTTATDDPAITLNSITLGKYIFPRVIKLPDDLGMFRVSGSANIIQFEPCDFNRLMMKSQIEEIKGPYGYYSRVGDAAYIMPYVLEGSAIIIADNPMDVPINDSGVIRAMTFSDNYPLDPILAQRAILDLLTKDLAINEGTVSDIINDSQSQLKILKEYDTSLLGKNNR